VRVAKAHDFFFGAEAHYPLDAGAVVPATVEDHDLAGRREVRQVALDIHLGLLAVGRLRKRDDPEHARAHPLGDPFDDPALPGGVTAFEHDADLEPLAHDPLLEPNQLALEASQLLAVALAAELLDRLPIRLRLLSVAHGCSPPTHVPDARMGRQADALSFALA
jgi:hypothetical protein